MLLQPFTESSSPRNNRGSLSRGTSCCSSVAALLLLGVATGSIAHALLARHPECAVVIGVWLAVFAVRERNARLRHTSTNVSSGSSTDVMELTERTHLAAATKPAATKPAAPTRATGTKDADGMAIRSSSLRLGGGLYVPGLIAIAWLRRLGAAPPAVAAPSSAWASASPICWCWWRSCSSTARCPGTSDVLPNEAFDPRRNEGADGRLPGRGPRPRTDGP